MSDPKMPASLLSGLVTLRKNAEKAREALLDRELFWTVHEREQLRIKYNEARRDFFQARRKCVYLMSFIYHMSDVDVADVMGDGMTPEIVQRFRASISLHPTAIPTRTRLYRATVEPPLGVPVDLTPKHKKASRKEVRARLAELKAKNLRSAIPVDRFNPGSG